jgi:integrase
MDDRPTERAKPRHEKLTKEFVKTAAVATEQDRTTYPDETLPGFALEVRRDGSKSFVVSYRVGRGRHAPRRQMKIADAAVADPTVARQQAKKILAHVVQGRDPLAEQRAEAAKAAGTCKAIAEDYFARECGMVRDANGKAVFPEPRDGTDAKLRSAPDRLKTFERLIYPVLGAKPIGDIRRGDIVRLLDRIADERGEVMADRTLAYLRKLLNWHAVRCEDYTSPIVKGMTRANGRQRERILTDDELRAVWRAAGDFGAFGAMVKFILLTTARRNEAAKLRWTEIDGADWTLPAKRNKTKVDLIRSLPMAAQDVLAGVTQFKGCPYVFSNDGANAIGGYGKFKAELQKTSGTSGWSLHDLRRTARSLLSRAGVPSDHAEHVLGHLLPGMKKVYDRHKYCDEKKVALEKLAALLDRIVNPPASNVASLDERRAAVG